MITTLTQLSDLAESVADIGRCGVSPLITREYLNIATDQSLVSEPNTDRLLEEGGRWYFEIYVMFKF